MWLNCVYEIETASGPIVDIDWGRFYDYCFQCSLTDVYRDELLDDVVDELFDCSGTGPHDLSVAEFFKSGNVAYLFKCGMLPDMSKDTSIIQGSDGHWISYCLPYVSSRALGGVVKHEERKWEVCWFASTSAGASGGIYSISSMSSEALNHYVQFFGLTGCKTTKVWTPAVSHAIAATDSCVGSRGTRDCLISVLEKNQIPNYFKNAQTEIYFLAGGNYQKHYVPWFLQQKVDWYICERKWEVCWFVSSSAGASGGFYSISSMSSEALNQYLQFFGLTGCKTSKVWTPDVSHAIAATDSCVGSRGTRDCLISVLEKNQIPNYFKNAQTEIYFLAGGNYQKHYVPWFLQQKVQKVPSSAASAQFVRGLKNIQPQQRLKGSKDTVYLLQWYYTPEKGLGFHGMWVGETYQNRGKSFVRCVNNDIGQEPYKFKLREVVEDEVRGLPDDLLEEMEMSWSSRPEGKNIIEYAASQFLKHAIQGEEFLVEDYWSKATELSKLLTNTKLEEIMRTYDFERGKYYPCEDLQMAVSNEVKAQARVTYKPHSEYGVVPYGFTLLLDYQSRLIDHVNTEAGHDKFTFG